MCRLLESHIVGQEALLPRSSEAVFHWAGQGENFYRLSGTVGSWPTPLE